MLQITYCGAIALASHVLANQRQFYLRGGSCVWLDGIGLRETHAVNLVNELLNNEYINCADATEATLVTHAAAAGRFELMDMLLDVGVKASAIVICETSRNWSGGDSDLHAVVKRLLTAGADPDSGCKRGTSLQFAAGRHDMGLIELLLQAGARQVAPNPAYSFAGPAHSILR